MQRYFINKNQINDDIVTIKDKDVHHIKNVMRMKINDEVIVCDETNSYICKIESMTDEVILQIVEKIDDSSELEVNVTIAHGLVKKEKQEEVIKKLVELGCSSYIPLKTIRSIVKIKDNDKINSYLERVNKIVKEASEQSQRTNLMKVVAPVSFKELISTFPNYDLILFASAPARNNINLKSTLRKNKYKNILVIIGPEGGFDDSEIELLSRSDVITTSFGKRVLRTETAPLFIMSVLGYEVENNEC